MGNIFGYELRRLLGNKFSAGLAALTLAYSYWKSDRSHVVL